MTSNNPEHDNSSAASGRPASSDPRGFDEAGVRSSGAPSREPGRTGNPPATSTASSLPRTGQSSSGNVSAGAGSGAPSTEGTRDKAKGKAGDKVKKAGKASSGGDWNVFRTVVVLVGLVIAGFGAYYLILGTAGLPDTEASPVNPTLENQFRFFSAMMVGVGAAFITIAIKFEWANMLWLVCLMVFIGGIGRVLSWAFSGTPNYVMIVLMVVELAFPPALLVWHKYIAKTSAMRKEFAQRD
ncbi:MAG: hypothetical protein JWM61_1660 [Micrococcaceae bacterium]|uniref:DUF4345 domain-containing protein n=1 Tax=Arthrobacter sp. PL16 TaxID=3071720 RepID=UPI002DF7F964|nr:hypothetical protein [Micrococcaceae bacterium]MEC5200727.1 hypothetical protein [Arthrobacter sp. PL16]